MLYNHFNRRLNTMLTVAENHTRTLCVALREKDAATTAVAVAEAMQSAVDSNNSNNAPRETATAVAG
jgi:hypothetical protein